MSELLNLNAKLVAGKPDMNLTFSKPTKIGKLALKSIAGNSPPYTIPKKAYTFLVYNDEKDPWTVTKKVDNKYYPGFIDILANLERKFGGLLRIYYATNTESVNLVATYAGYRVALFCDAELGDIMGGIEVADQPGYRLISCDYKYGVVHLFRKPVIPATINLHLVNSMRKNETDLDGKQSFRLATLAASHGKLARDFDSSALQYFVLDETFHSIVFRLSWSDGVEYLTLDENVNIVLAIEKLD